MIGKMKHKTKQQTKNMITMKNKLIMNNKVDNKSRYKDNTMNKQFQKIISFDFTFNNIYY